MKHKWYQGLNCPHWNTRYSKFCRELKLYCSIERNNERFKILNVYMAYRKIVLRSSSWFNSFIRCYDTMRWLYREMIVLHCRISDRTNSYIFLLWFIVRSFPNRPFSSWVTNFERESRSTPIMKYGTSTAIESNIQIYSKTENPFQFVIQRTWRELELFICGVPNFPRVLWKIM